MKTLRCPNRDSELRVEDESDTSKANQRCVACGAQMVEGEHYPGVDHLALVPDPNRPDLSFRGQSAEGRSLAKKGE